MKKLALLCTSLLMTLPAISIAAPCSCPAYSYDYSGSVKGHSATINKTQTYQAANNLCTINSTITVKAFITKVVKQQEVGVCSNSALTSQTFSTDQSGDMQPSSLNAGEFGPLFFALYLGNAISANNTVCPGPASVFIDGKLVPMQCTQINPNTTVPIGAGKPALATEITYTALDNSATLTYDFSNDKPGLMLRAISSSPASSVVIDQL